MNHAACLYEDSDPNTDSEPEDSTPSSTLDSSPRFTMKESVDNILSLTVAQNNWTQEICLLEDTNSKLKVDLSPAIMNEPSPHTPKTATNQPS